VPCFFPSWHRGRCGPSGGFAALRSGRAGG
jgi:hypothetical protein